MTNSAPPDIGVATQVYRVFIRATPQKIWDAITNPDWTQRFGYGLRDEFELRPGGQYRGWANEGMKAMGMSGVIVDGEVIEADPPRKLVITWRMAIDPNMATPSSLGHATTTPSSSPSALHSPAAT